MFEPGNLINTLKSEVQEVAGYGDRMSYTKRYKLDIFSVLSFVFVFLLYLLFRSVDPYPHCGPPAVWALHNSPRPRH